MAQRVQYEPFPGTRYDQYIFKLRMVLGSLQQPAGLKFKTFRDFARKQNLWDKDKSESLFSLVDITWDKTNVKLGKTAKRLASAHSDGEFQQILFERLKEENILLVKYVLEALDVNQGGRLHSEHELYRMITSYVYPGTYITLTAFQAWIQWMAASGAIKMIGIRWALSERGQKVVGELRAMDVDEILEDMEDGDEGDDEEDDEDADLDPFADEDEDLAPAPKVPSFGAPRAPVFGNTPAAAPKAKAKPVVEDIDDDEDLFDDLPPEPELPDPSVIAAANRRLGLSDDEDEDDELPPPPPKARYTPPAGLSAPTKAAAKAEPAVPAAGKLSPAAAAVAVASPGIATPVVAASYAVVPVSALASADAEALKETLSKHYALLKSWPAFTAPELGVLHDPSKGDLKLLIELSLLAVLVEGLEPQPQVFAFVKALREASFFETLGMGEGLEAALDAIENLSDLPWARPLVERLVHARYLTRKIANKIDLLFSLKQAASGAEALALLREHLFGQAFVEAPFWVLRELSRLGLLDEKVKSATAVPTKALRDAAGLIGLAPLKPTLDLASLDALSESVAALFGTEDLGFGEALANYPRALGLSR